MTAFVQTNTKYFLTVYKYISLSQIAPTLQYHCKFNPEHPITPFSMVIKKRMLLWDWTDTKECPWAMEKVNFNGPIASVSNWNTQVTHESPPTHVHH